MGSHCMCAPRAGTYQALSTCDVHVCSVSYKSTWTAPPPSLSVDPVNGKVELSLRLSQVDPEAAKKARREAQAKEQDASSSGGLVQKRHNVTSDEESVEARYIYIAVLCNTSV